MPIIPPAPGNSVQGGASNTYLTGLNSGQTSQSSGFIPDYLSIIKEAGQRSGVDTTTADGIRSAKLSLDFMQAAWANYGLNLWTLVDRTLPLVQGQNIYTLFPDTVDVLPNPVIRTFPQPGKPQDIGIAMVDYVTWINLVNKAEQGKPNMCYVQRNATPQVFFWLTPDGNGPYYFYYWMMRRLQTTGYQTNLPDIPFRYLEPLASGLAWQMSLKKKEKDLNLIMLLKTYYDEAMRMARGEDHVRSEFHVQPFVGWGGSW